MNLDRILLGTTSADKLREISDILQGLPVTLVTPGQVGELPHVNEDASTFRENACKKALSYARQFNMPVLAEDSGLEVDSLGGRPGVRSRRYAGSDATDAENNFKLLAELEGMPPERRTARYRCVVVLATPEKVLLTTEGRCEGRITDEPVGYGGFGYDPLFFYPPFGVTFGQLDARLKNQVSHRANALRHFREELVGLLKDRLPAPADATGTTGP